jgi:hypothetical protein
MEKSEMAVSISGVIDYLTTIDLRDSDISVRATAVQLTVRRGAVVVVVGLTVVVRLGDVVAVVVVFLGFLVLIDCFVVVVTGVVVVLTVDVVVVVVVVVGGLGGLGLGFGAS